MPRKKIPPSNNAGHTKQPLSYDLIIRTQNYQFQGRWLQAYMSEDEYKKFVQAYVTGRENAYRHNYYKPNDAELLFFERYERGEITYSDFKKQMNYNSNQAAKYKLGQIYAYKLEQRQKLAKKKTA